MSRLALHRNNSTKLSDALRVLEAELNWRKENERIQFFEPNGKQEEFIQKFASLDSLIYIFSASNALGKTTLCVNLLGNIVFGTQNKYFDYPIFKNWPYPKRARYITNPKLVEEISPFHTEIKKWWPKGQYEPLKGGKNYFSQYKAKDWVIDVMSYDQEPSQFEGSTLGLVLFDEPPPEPLWTPSIRGLRGKGKSSVFMTPLTSAAWFYDKVVPAHQDTIVYGKMEDGCKTHGIRGHLEHVEIQKQIDELMITRPDEVEARVYGRAMYLQGLIFKTFNPQIHILKESVFPGPNSTIYQVVDPHTDKPFACIWAYVDGRGDVTIFDEWPNQDFYSWHNCQLTISDYKTIFLEKEQGLRIHKRIIDRHFAEVSHLSGMTRNTLRDEFRNVGIDFFPSYQASEEIDAGIAKVRDYLKYNDDRPIDIMNKPKLFINPGCQNTIKSMMRWARDPKTNKVQENYKDFCDVVRYLVMDNPQIEIPVPYEPARKMWG